MSAGIRTAGKFFVRGEAKVYPKGVSYGPFKEASHGRQFPEKEQVVRDFALMRELGVNCLRTYTSPPAWLLELAEQWNLLVMAGIPWAEHVTFLDSKAVQKEIRIAVTAVVEECKGYNSLFCYMVGNEIPSDIIRWHGAEKVQNFLRELTELIRGSDPDALVSYANFPSTEYLELDFVDFHCFNVYLHRQEVFQKYLGRLQNLAGNKPLVLSEFGADSIREGVEGQAHILDQKLRTSFEMGAAGTVVFAWTDEWFTGGHAITDWAFGVVSAERQPKPAFDVVKRYYQEPLPPLPAECPKVSVVVCAYNADRTIDTCLAALETVRYPNYEVIVVNDGSNDGTLDICRKYPYIRLICQENKGLSVARNVGLEAATGEIVAYTDADCDVDPDWITYLVHGFRITGEVAVGGPNLPPPEDSLVPSAVAVSPGGPTHVLIDDMEAEHIAGCNMAFKADVLRDLGGFDAQYRAAGDDVDICWRLQDAGHSIGFSPSAQVWHFRRNTVKDYFNQQRGYGKAEAMVYYKHPERFNLLGQARWLGRIYGDLSTSLLPGKPFIYSGVFGMAPFQSLYQRPASLWTYLPQTLEWNVFGLAMLVLSPLAGVGLLLGAIPVLITLGSSLISAWRAPVDPRFTGLRSRLLISYLILGGPLVRSIERYKWRRKLLGKEGAPSRQSATPLRTRFPLQRTYGLNFWSDKGIERDIILKDVINQLQEKKYFVNIQNGWERWDFRVQQGLWAWCYVYTATEIHGGYERLHRLKLKLRLSGLAQILFAMWAVLFVIVIACKSVIAALLMAIPGIALLWAFRSQMSCMATALGDMVKISAKKLDLTPAPPK
ncbi:glycosyltransferase [Synechococcus sp. Cruz-9H2]|nr:glycosyltransferase [Synechococcus sp. Edmonson 11F2]MCP9819745.1 glycosyltransferase [Synechococcus sp. Cruz-9H2]MCP9856175.1 glycosyltransferase [Synechococcus sp. Cruz-9C9]MCP9863460.1 glycosyltransferase [Synechococcus sp. Cruz-7E5]MCP9870656.1 glycosyltransferase [Synechococcus sp. Cruz-7B9]MCP9844189.1 glycosyltransferase [Synechococcus sp. Edmonson 11F2]